MNYLMPTEVEMKTMETMAENAKNSQLFGKMNGSAGILCILLSARELGVPLMQALCGGIRNIQGNIEMSPRLMNTMIRRAGHQIHILRCDEEICTLKGIRKDTGEIYECSYSIEDAKRAGLAGKDNYRKHPSDMLFARCMSLIGRRLFADVIGTAYVEGEISEEAASRPVSKKAAEPEEVIVEVINEDEETITEGEMEEMEILMDKIKDQKSIENLYKKINAKHISEVKRKDYNTIIKSLKKKILIETREERDESSRVA